MDFKTSFKANNGKEYDVAVPVPVTKEDHFVRILRKEDSAEILRIDLNYYSELPDIVKQASESFNIANNVLDEYTKKEDASI